ncbi:C40 family peptidase [Promicromonospora iranensis]|uniref:Cell wall-associated NlpC family hydrolase n=1 Tax=Promicromonospora iranensis TaxID=1105144 RepID=A0ABU2CUK1_9MICO|nr:C40 family peptidase [Promicromonospora iranensis]MDR7384827.1 cell wall-associated NlpC family hydrolase [Promicromonospora iranensis]
MDPQSSTVTSQPRRGRHRAAHRPLLTSVAQAATSQAGVITGRGAVIAAAGSGVLLSLIAPSAHAAPASEVSTTLAGTAVKGKLNSTDLNALASQARQTVAAANVVTVTPTAELNVEKSAVSVVSAAENAEYQEARAAEIAAEEAAQRRASVVSVAMRYIGVPYVWGGTTPAGFDCSGFTSYVFAQVGIDLPRTSSAQRYAGTAVSWAEAQPGDLIWTPGHIAIYAGGGMQIEAPVPGKSVRYTSIWQSGPTFIRVG